MGFRNVAYFSGSSAIRHVDGLKSGSDALVGSLSRFQDPDSATSLDLAQALDC